MNFLKRKLRDFIISVYRGEFTALEANVTALETKTEGLQKSLEDLQKQNLADENDFISFYKVLLNRVPEDGAIRTGEISRKDLFDSIVDSEEFTLVKAQNQIEDGNVSYAQAGEDVILIYVFGVLGISLREVTYLDLGANRVKNLSNTYFLYERGAHGVLVDANPVLCKSLQTERDRDITLNNCISDKDGEAVDFYILNNDGLSSADKAGIEETMKIDSRVKLNEIVKVETITVNTILKRYFKDKAPTILNVDIEGNEMEILSSIDFSTTRPLIIICEMIPYDTELVVGIKNQEIMQYMRAQGYEEYAFTGINSIFIDVNKNK